MDAEYLRSLQAHTRYTADISSLLSDPTQGITPGLGLGTYAPHSALTTSAAATRSFGPIPGYAGHTLHQISPDSHLQSIASQSAYKPVSQSPFFETSSRSSDPYSSLRLGTPSTKSLFPQDGHSVKEVSYSSVVPQSPGLDVAQKQWGLSNFMSSGANSFLPTDLVNEFLVSAPSIQPSLAPPPAHSSKTTPPVQRNPYSGSEMFPSRSTRSPPIQTMYDHRIATATPATQTMFSYSQPSTGMYLKAETTYKSSDSMNYEAVSPATPLSEQNSQIEPYNSLQDLASISSTQQKLEISTPAVVNKPPPMIPDSQNKIVRKANNKTPLPVQQDVYSGHTSNQNSQMSHLKHTPSQPPSVDVGGSPLQMQIGSPQMTMASSTVVAAPPPVQAPADSTTKTKKARARKKKNQIEDVQQVYNQQSYTDSPDVHQRNNFMANQQSLMSNSRSTPQSYNNDNLNEGQSHLRSTPQSYNNDNLNEGQSHLRSTPPSYNNDTGNLNEGQSDASPLMSNNGYGKGQNQTFKSEPSPVVMPQQSPVPQSPMLGVYPTATPTSVNSMSYSVSDALEMSREAVYANQNFEGFPPSELGQFGFQQQLGQPMDLVESMRRNDLYPTEEGVYPTAYGGQYVSPNSVLNVDMTSPQASGTASTIDEAAFSSLMDPDAYGREQSPDKMKYRSKLDEKPMPYDSSMTVKVDDEQDDEFTHLHKPPMEKKEPKPHVNRPIAKQMVMTEPVKKPIEPQPAPSLAPKVDIRSSGGSSFMDSFLGFIQGKKTETLSSMSSAIIHNKPQLPKYIPEPRRPRKVEVEVKKEDHDTNDSVSQNSIVVFSDDDESDGGKEKINSAVKSVISDLGEENDKVKISTNKSGGLTMKINLTKVKKAEESAKRLKSRKSPKSKKRSKDRSKMEFGFHERRPKAGNSSGEENRDEDYVPREKVARKAKEKRSKYVVSSGSDSDTLKPIVPVVHNSDSDRYDSDKDPAWTPFDLHIGVVCSGDDSNVLTKHVMLSEENIGLHRPDKKTPAYDAIDFDPRKKSLKKIRSRPSKHRKSSGEKHVPPPPLSVGGGNVNAALNRLQKVPHTPEQSAGMDRGKAGAQPDTDSKDMGGLKMGQFVIEKKDMKNVESYPIWKIESGRMLHKFELFAEGSRMLHKAMSTYSSWLPSMDGLYIPVRVRSVFKQGDNEHVEVLEESRPKPEPKVEEKYSQDPLFKLFNIYLQTFLSQALEPDFLSAIREDNERYHLDPLDEIDSYIDQKLQEIDAAVRWKPVFKECIKTRPHIREIDKPNAKIFCQACEFSNQTAVKSVHLFGNPYNRFSLEEVGPDGTQGAQEFMIGRTAAIHVKPYHNLYHFKYNLFKRCLAKVTITQDGMSSRETAAILDKCLQNRAWVIQIFEDLQQMLEKG